MAGLRWEVQLISASFYGGGFRLGRGVVLCLLGLLLSACSRLGHGGEGASFSRDEYVERANAICAEANRHIRALGPPPGSVREQAAMAREVNEISRRALAGVSALPAPEVDAPMLASLYDRANQALNAADRSTRAIERGDAARANRAAARAARTMAGVNQALAQYGLTECAR